MENCSRCEEFDLTFNRKFRPSDFLEGKKNSLIWIVGLNPYGGPKTDHQKGLKELENYFDGSDIHPYFNDFKRVSERLFELLGKDKGAAHTDVVKCFSKKFPSGKNAEIIINNCKNYLYEQIKKYSPKIILCNGVPVCKVIKEIIKPAKPDIGKNTTSYIGYLNNNKIAVILSGFVGRIDNYAKCRLGKEIESYMRMLYKNEF